MKKMGEMMMMNKVFRVLKTCFLSVLATVLLLSPAVGQAAASDPAAKAQLEAAYAAMEQVKSGNVVLEFLGKTMLADATGNLNVNFVAKPTVTTQGKCKLVLGDAAKPSAMEYDFYTVDEEKNYTLYYKDDKDQWYKEVYSKEESSKKAAQEKDDPNYQAFAQELKDCEEAVRFGKDDGKQQTYLVTVDGAKLWPAVSKYAKTQIKSDNKKDFDPDVIFEALAGMGDVEYEVTVDKATNQVVAAKIDLSKPLGNFVSSIMNNAKVEAQTKTVVGMFLSGAQLTIQATGSQYNQVSEIKVPDSVVKNAKPAPKGDKKAKEDKAA